MPPKCETRTRDDFMLILDLFDADLYTLNCRPLFAPNTTYARAWFRDQRKELLIHRVIMERMLGRKLLTSERVDHRNGNGLDCRRKNLRLATPAQNAANTGLRKDNTSGKRGVYSDGAKWRACIRVQGKLQYLGRYDDPDTAYAVYKKAAVKQWGEFAQV